MQELHMGRHNLQIELSEREGQLKSLVSAWTAACIARLTDTTRNEAKHRGLGTWCHVSPTGLRQPASQPAADVCLGF